MNARCGRCGAVFAKEAYLHLHVGRAHDGLDADERAAFAAAETIEDAWMARFRRHVRGGLAVLPIFLSLVVILLLADLGGIPIFLGLLLIPGSAAMAAVLYYMQLTKPEG